MKFFKQLAIIVAFSLIGELISFLIKLLVPSILIPGSLIGMVLLFLALKFNILKYNCIENLGEFFVNNMGFFFVPSAVAIMNEFGILAPIWWKLLIIVFVSFLLTFVCVGLSVKLTVKIQDKINAKRGKVDD